MHELAIAESILDAIRAETARPERRVVGVGVRVGEVSSVEPSALEFAFDALVKGTDLANLSLTIERVAYARRCPRCATEFVPKEGSPGCPDCREPATQFVRGDELEIAWLEVEEPCHV
jgi:hydrogenase nickel incorporation protein HypA/HybF